LTEDITTNNLSINFKANNRNDSLLISLDEAKNSGNATMKLKANNTNYSLLNSTFENNSELNTNFMNVTLK